jgi:cytoskeleton protein RodZ
MSGASGGAELRGIGARLRAAREHKGLTVLQAAERLHVDARVLDALEAEDFSSLGADVYVRGHLRRYADLTGESAAELQELYGAGAPGGHPDLTRIPHSPAPRASSVLVLPALLLVVGAAIAGVVWWALKLPAQKPSQPSTAAVPQSGQAAAAPRSAPAPVTPPPISSSNAGAAAASPPAAQLDLSFSGASWVEIADADGHHLLHGLIAPGSARELGGTPPWHVVLGNSPVVAVQVNGRAVSLEGLTQQDGSARLLIDATGHASPVPARLAHGD